MRPEIPENAFVRAYRKQIAEPAHQNEAYGYWLFATGAILGVAGFLLFLWSTTLERGTELFWFARQWAIVLSSIGLPLLMLGVILRLPVRRSINRVGELGVLICLAAAAWFSWVYPGAWNVPVGDQAPLIISVYAVGTALIITAALILPAFSRPADWAPLNQEQAGEPAEDDEDSTETGADGVAGPGESRFEVYQDHRGAFRWRLRHENGRLIADGARGYATQKGAEQAAERTKSYATAAETLELGDRAFQVYEDAAGEFRWRLFAPTGRIIAESGGGFASKRGADEAIAGVQAVEESEFEVVEDAAGEFRWRLLGTGGRILASSGQGFASDEQARSSVERVKGYLGSGEVLERADGEGAFQVYEDAAGEFRWRLFAPTGEIIAEGGAGYASELNADRGASSVKNNAPDAPVVTLIEA